MIVDCDCVICAILRYSAMMNNGIYRLGLRCLNRQGFLRRDHRVNRLSVQDRIYKCYFAKFMGYPCICLYPFLFIICHYIYINMLHQLTYVYDGVVLWVVDGLNRVSLKRNKKETDIINKFIQFTIVCLIFFIRSYLAFI